PPPTAATACRRQCLPPATRVGPIPSRSSHESPVHPRQIVGFADSPEAAPTSTGGHMGTQKLIQEDLGQRRYDLDWVRIGAFILLIFYHVGMYYVSWDWHVKSPHASSALEPLMMLTQPWRLSLLFLVSGVATAYLLGRQGSRGFLRHRAIRLLVPLVFGMAVIIPPQSYLEVVEKLAYAGSYTDFLKLYFTAYHGFCRGSDCLILPTWNHLWFVA